MSPSNVSSVVNFFTTPNEGFTTTLGTTIISGATTVPINSNTGLVNGTIFVGIIEPGATNEQVFTGTVNTAGLQITNVVWTRGTNVGHTAGVTIVDYVTGTAIKMISTGVLVDHTQTGAHKELHDANGKAWIDQGATASAVNNIKVSNSATTNPPIIAAGGSDTNISINIAPKGTGVIQQSGTQIGPQFLKNPYKFSVYRNASANSGNGAFALLSFDTKIFDTGTNYSTSTGQFTAPIAGFYQFDWYVQTTQGSGSHNFQANLSKNGTSTTVASGSAAWSGSANNITTGAAFLQLSANDTIQVMLYGDTTLAVNVTNSTANFQGFLVSAT